MASITRVNGDIFSGVDQNTDLGSLVTLNGAQVAAYGILLQNVSGTTLNIDAEGGADKTIDVVLRAIEGKGTLTYYQVETNTPWQISVLVERSGWTAATLQAAIRALGTAVGVTGLDVSGSVVTNVGLKLSLS